MLRLVQRGRLDLHARLLAQVFGDRTMNAIGIDIADRLMPLFVPILVPDCDFDRIAQGSLLSDASSLAHLHGASILAWVLQPATNGPPLANHTPPILEQRPERQQDRLTNLREPWPRA